MKRVLITLHGINTRGTWQKLLIPFMTKLEDRWILYPLDYDYFGPLALLAPKSRQKKIDWFRAEYTNICLNEDVKYPSIIAHSFGTYIVGEALKKYPQIYFDKVILCGSILPQKYDWNSLVVEKRVNSVKNDYGSLDIWPSVARHIISHAGSSGKEGFVQTNEHIDNCKFEKYKHSNYFHPLHFKSHWIPFLKEFRPNEKLIDKLTGLLIHLTEIASVRFSIPKRRLRATFFSECKDGILRIPNGLYFNMPNIIERGINIYKGFGCVGKSYEEGLSAIAIREGNNWPLPMMDEESRKVHRQLRWVISMPVMNFRRVTEVLGILNLDCLRSDKKEKELKKILGDMKYLAQQFSKTIDNES
jgi:hypothetical protein